MKKIDNTGLGLIKATIERVQNEKSLFNSALKKLVNSTEKELDAFLKRKIGASPQQGILRPISEGTELKLKALDGNRLISKQGKAFIPYFNELWEINKLGVATSETPILVHEIVGDGTFMDIFSSVPGIWAEKWLSQDQVIEFCESLPDWLFQEGYGTFFLIKKKENKPIDETKPEENLAVVYVYVFSGDLYVRVYRLEDGSVWRGDDRHHVASPQLIPLSE